MQSNFYDILTISAHKCQFHRNESKSGGFDSR